jgi:hypothetical protein
LTEGQPEARRELETLIAIKDAAIVFINAFGGVELSDARTILIRFLQQYERGFYDK